jgi:hypothetical protein
MNASTKVFLGFVTLYCGPYIPEYHKFYQNQLSKLKVNDCLFPLSPPEISVSIPPIVSVVIFVRYKRSRNMGFCRSERGRKIRV